MTTNTIDYRAMRAALQRDGYVVVPDIFDADRLALANTAIDRLAAGDDRSCWTMARDPALGGMLLDPVVLRLVAMALHPAVQVTAFHWGVVDAHSEHMNGRWHQDGPMTKHLMVDGVAPMCNLAVGFVCSDQSQPGRGNTRVLPGSHRQAIDVSDRQADESLPGEVPVLAAAGDVILFYGATWHSASPNPSSIQRRTIWSKWNFLWMHQVDAMHELAADAAWWNALSLEAQQVLGGMYHQPKWYFNPHTVPLQAAVDEILS